MHIINWNDEMEIAIGLKNEFTEQQFKEQMIRELEEADCPLDKNEWIAISLSHYISVKKTLYSDCLYPFSVVNYIDEYWVGKIVASE